MGILSENTERRMVAFVRTVANRCMTCLHKNYVNCRNCLSSWANELMKDYQVDLATSERDDIADYTMGARIAYIRKVIARHGRPVRSNEIDVRNICTRQLKRWTLQKMVRMGVLKRSVTEVDGKKCYCYSVVEEKKEKKGGGK